MRSITHPHLINPITALEHGQDQYVIFPFADGGNLREFWKAKDRKPNVEWVLKQMHGVSQAIMLLHDQNGRHGDIKPENILRFRGQAPSQDTLVIADVGLAKFHELVTSQRDHASSITARTVRYEAPEMNVDNPEKPRSRRYDIWSIGCVYLEFVVWAVYGSPVLKDFNARANYDKFWDFEGGKFDDSKVTGGVKVVHPSVQEMIGRLRKDLPKDSALSAVVSMVREGLLVIDLARDVGRSKHVRWNAPKFFERMDAIWKRAKTDRAYTVGGKR